MFPETPEGVALYLWSEILLRVDAAQLNIPLTAYMLDLFADCLKAARGERGEAREELH